MLLLVVSLLEMPTIVSPDVCRLETKDTMLNSRFILNDKHLVTIRKGIGISTHNNSTKCILPLREIIDTIDIPENMIVISFFFMCKNKIRIEINDGNSSKVTNVTSYLQLTNCILDVTDLGKFGNIFDLRVIHVIRSDIKSPKIQSESDCLGLNKIVALTIRVDQTEKYPTDLQSILGCQDTFTLMAEVAFVNMSWAKLPDYVQYKFPNLQAIDLRNNFLTVPPDFPWSVFTMTLPANLSRTSNFQDLYSRAFYMEIPLDIFQRTMVLDNNNITDLSSYNFSGILHMLSINSNGLKRIGVNTFSSLKGLQTLLLSFNELSYIPESALNLLSSLKYLDLYQNKLTFIKNYTFKSLLHISHISLPLI